MTAVNSNLQRVQYSAEIANRGLDRKGNDMKARKKKPEPAEDLARLIAEAQKEPGGQGADAGGQIPSR